MAPAPSPGIYLSIDFDWPDPWSKEHADNARKLHDAIQGKI